MDEFVPSPRHPAPAEPPPAQARPWLSILIPVYNVEEWLRPCVASVLQQIPALAPTQRVEILLLDDASTDGSARVMESLAAEHAGQLRLLRHARNAGLSAARNSLLHACTGHYVWFLDSDDLLMPGALRGLALALNQQACDLVLCDFTVVREHTRLKHRLRGEHHRHTFRGPARKRLNDTSVLLEGLFAEGKLHTWSKIARRELWADDLRFPVGRYYEDLYTSPELALRARSYLYIPECWVGYRQRAGSILATLNENKLKDMMDSLVGLPQRLHSMQPPLSDGARFAIAHYIARSYVSAARFIARRANTAALHTCHTQLLASLPMSPAQLIRHYLRRGWFWRALRLHFWLRRGEGAAA